MPRLRLPSRADIGRMLRAMPFTLLMLATLVLVGVLTHSVLRVASRRWSRAYGFAPNDLLTRNGWRMFTATFLTAGFPLFWSALLMMILFVGGLELIAGSWTAALSFWGIDIVSLVLKSRIEIWSYLTTHHQLNLATLVFRDVGPSAGYFGAFGVLCAYLPRRRGVSLACVGTAIMWLQVSYATSSLNYKMLTAVVDHGLSIPLGFAIGLFLARPVGAEWCDAVARYGWAAKSSE